MQKQSSFATPEKKPCRAPVCRNAAGVIANPKGLARAILQTLQASDSPMTVDEIVIKLRRRFREFSIVSMVERMDDFNRLTMLWSVQLGRPVFTVDEKLGEYKRAGRLGGMRIRPIPDLWAVLEDANEL